MREFSVCAGAAFFAFAAASANADVLISKAPTRSMSCIGGLCAPTAADAVLNVTDLEALLKAGPVAVTTTGAAVEANDIVIRSAMKWTSKNALELQAGQSITFKDAVSVGDAASLSLYTNGGGAGGTLVFAKNGHVTFSRLSSTLAINGTNYALVSDIKSLAGAIAANPAGNFALAANYDASADGTYSTAPISTVFTGVFEGLGNEIHNFAINDPNFENIGLFADLEGGRISDIGIVDASVAAFHLENGLGYTVGVLLGYNNGIVSGSYSTGSVQGTAGEVGALIGMIDLEGIVDHSHSSASVAIASGTEVNAGGLVGWNYGTITGSYATGPVSSTVAGDYVAGLVGFNGGTITTSFATGAISAGTYSYCGGLAGANVQDKRDGFKGVVENSYATGNLSCTGLSDSAGGFVADNASAIRKCYSTGIADGYEGQYEAGFIVYEYSPMSMDYWNTTTSGTDQGVYYGSWRKGLTGLTTEQLQSGLPQGFSAKIWAEAPGINSGFPYLIDNPPPK